MRGCEQEVEDAWWSGFQEGHKSRQRFVLWAWRVAPDLRPDFDAWESGAVLDWPVLDDGSGAQDHYVMQLENALAKKLKHNAPNEHGD